MSTLLSPIAQLLDHGNMTPYFPTRSSFLHTFLKLIRTALLGNFSRYAITSHAYACCSHAGILLFITSMPAAFVLSREKWSNFGSCVHVSSRSPCTDFPCEVNCCHYPRCVMEKNGFRLLGFAVMNILYSLVWYVNHYPEFFYRFAIILTTR